MAHALDSYAKRAHFKGHLDAICVAAGTGTTDAVADTAELVTHGAVDENGNAYAAADLMVLAMATSSEAAVYQSGAVTATTIDIRSSGTAVPYNWFLFVVT
jgi:hypothetical protein